MNRLNALIFLNHFFPLLKGNVFLPLTTFLETVQAKVIKTGLCVFLYWLSSKTITENKQGKTSGRNNQPFK